GLRDESELHAAWDRLSRRADDLGRRNDVAGFLIQEMAQGILEAFAGVSRDPDFGLVLAFGAGGVLIEALDDVALRPLPLRAGHAVDGISLDIAKGEFLTLLGPSGSGKTTTLMMIAGFEEPASGVIELGGEDLTRRKPYERNIGVVFQNYALFPHMTVEENVAF